MPCTAPISACRSASSASRVRQVVADLARVVLQLLVARWRRAPSARRRTTPGCRRPRRRSSPGCGSASATSRRGDHRAERMAVAHRLGDGDDVGHHALLLEAPEPVAEPAVADLHLVGDRQPAVRRAPRRTPRRGSRRAARCRPRCRRTVSQMNAAGGRPLRRERFDDRDGVGGVPGRIVAAVLAAEAVGGSARCAPSRDAWSSAFGLSATEVETASVRVGPAVVRLRARRARRAVRWRPARGAARGPRPRSPS